MKQILKITLVGAMVISSYLFGSTQMEIKEISDIPDGYIALEDCIPLEDISCSFIDQYGYRCFELKDVGNQLDDPGNKSYADIIESMENENYFDMCVNMQNLMDFKATDSGLQLYFNDGTGYYWSR